MEGPFAIGLQLSEAVAEDSFAAIIGEIVSSTVETAGSLLAARAIPILRSGIRTSAGFFAGRLKDKDPVIIAEDINQVALAGSHSLTLNLTAVETLKKRVPKRGTKATRKPPAKVILREGEVVATAEIQLTYFS